MASRRKVAAVLAGVALIAAFAMTAGIAFGI
jgi:hypothetical protein